MGTMERFSSFTSSHRASKSDCCESVISSGSEGGASSFPSDIPLVALSDLWEGREDGLFTAVLSGLEALHKRMSALQAENARLQLELDSCAAGKQRL